MIDVGIRELRRNLCEFLDRAQRGERFRITDHGRPKAVLGPLSANSRPSQGLEEGWIKPSSGGRLGQARRWPARERVLNVLAEDRGAD